MRRLPWFALALLFLGCGAPPTTVKLDIALASGAPSPSALSMSIYDRNHALGQFLALRQPITLPGAVIVDGLPDQAEPLRIVLESDPGTKLLGGVGVQLVPNTQVNAMATLAANTADRDGDGVPDALDDCPDTPNHDQVDGNGDGVGDACSTTVGDGAMNLPDAGRDGGLVDAATPIDAGDPCSGLAFVNAVPGTSLGQVMQNVPAMSQTIIEQGGDLLVAIAYGGQGPGQTMPLSTAPNMQFTVSDTLGNTWYAAPLVENSRSHQASLQIWFAPHVKAGSNTVTVKSSADQSVDLWTGLLLQEYAGIADSDVVDVSIGQMAPGSSADTQPGPMRVTAGCAVVVAAFADGHVTGQNITTVAGWQYRSTDAWDPSGCVDDGPGWARAGDTVNATMSLTVGADDGWVAQQVAFRAANTTPHPKPTGFAFLTMPRTVAKGACSPAVTIESRAGGVATPTSTGITLALSGGGLVFYADPACQFPIVNAYLGAGTSNTSFYFTGSVSGSPSLSANASTFQVVSQTETIN
jgi:hypothetical protein